MLSILIPIYNFDCKDLIETLHLQAIQADQPFEIIALDDGSEKIFHQANKDLDRLRFAKYIRNQKNQGRSVSRNRLALMARFDHLLFLDCDSKLLTNVFIRSYLENVGKGRVVQGGRVYPTQRPPMPVKWMHWKYGSQRESKTAAERTVFPYRWFHSNNFMIEKDLICQLPFNEDLKEYGYEDSLLASKLKSFDIPILHIDNPVIHLDILSNEDFLKKARMAVSNLHRLVNADEELNVKLVRSYKMCKRLKLSDFILSLYNKRKVIWEKKILQGEAGLREFDWYRLGYMLHLDQE